MAIKKTNDQNYKDIADAIRNKNDEQTKYKPDEMAAAIEAIPCKCFIATFDSDVYATEAVLNPSGDPIIAEHKDDISFVVGIIAMNLTTQSSLRASFAGSIDIFPFESAATYGIYLINNPINPSAGIVTIPITNSSTSSIGQMRVDSNGVIRLRPNSAYPLRAGSYIVVCGWNNAG